MQSENVFIFSWPCIIGINKYLEASFMNYEFYFVCHLINISEGYICSLSYELIINIRSELLKIRTKEEVNVWRNHINKLIFYVHPRIHQHHQTPNPLKNRFNLEENLTLLQSFTEN